MSAETFKWHYMTSDGLRDKPLCCQRNYEASTSSKRGVTCAKCRRILRLKASNVTPIRAGKAGSR